MYIVSLASLPSIHRGRQCLKLTFDYEEKDEDGGQEACVEDTYQTVKFCTSGIMELKLPPLIMINL